MSEPKPESESAPSASHCCGAWFMSYAYRVPLFDELNLGSTTWRIKTDGSEEKPWEKIKRWNDDQSFDRQFVLLSFQKLDDYFEFDSEI